jgi:hypothetical protein
MTDARARTITGARNGLRFLGYGFALLLALLTASCGSDIVQVGTPVITLSSKPGPFTSYVVTIDTITLTRQDGNVYQLPIVSQIVDLANLKAYTNLMEAPPEPVGTYVAADITVDYVSPVPALVNVNINGVETPTTLFDPVTQAAAVTQTIHVNFDPQHPFVINDQQSSVINFNIDLEASNLIGSPDATGTSQITVKPYWNVTAQPTYEKPVFARGLYVLADTKNSQLIMNVRPLHDIFNQPFGALKVNVDGNTYYNVNGVSYVGASGLAAIAALTNVFADLQVGVYGPSTGNPFADLSTIEPVFNATQVYVGSSQESTLEDQITGTIASIGSGTLTVSGAAFVDRQGDYGYVQTIPITVGSNTIVSKDGDPSPQSLSSLSIGQVVTVQGLSTIPDTATAFTPSSLDATGTVVPGAQIRMQNTPLVAQFNSANSASDALVNLVTVNGLQPTSYLGLNFSQTAGANPANYEISTPTDISATAPGTYLKVDGTMTALAAGPPFYTATSASTDVEQQLVITWTGNGSTNPFSAVNTAGILVNMADPALVGSTAQVRVGPNILAYLNGAQPPPTSTLTINYNASSAQHPLSLNIGSTSKGLYGDTDPPSFVSHVNTVQSSGVGIQKLVAYGQYDPTTGIFSATKMTINAQ